MLHNSLKGGLFIHEIKRAIPHFPFIGSYSLRRARYFPRPVGKDFPSRHRGGEGISASVIGPPPICGKTAGRTFTGKRIRGVLICVLEACVLAFEAQQDVANRTVTVLGNDDHRHATQIISVFVLKYTIVLGTVDENYHIGVLLDGSGFTQVGKLRTVIFRSTGTGAIFHTTVQLRKCQNRDVQLFWPAP